MYELLDHQDQLDFQEEELRAYFGPNAAYFLGQWELWREGNPNSLNPAAFLWGICWLVYRQMWLPATVAILLFWCFGLVETQLQPLLDAHISSTYLVWVRLGVLHLLIAKYGNQIYLQKTRREVDQVKMAFPPSEVIPELRTRGGTSRLAVVIFLLLLLSVAFCQLWGAPVGGPGRLFS